MSLKSKIIDKGNYIVVNITGKAEREGLDEACLAIIDESFECGKDRILYNAKDADVNAISKLTLFKLIRYYSVKLGVEYRKFRYAVVTGENFRHLAKFWKLIGNNRGFDVNLFDTVEEAENWLK